MLIDTVERLRTLYAMPKERALRKQLDALDPHCRSFIALSPFVIVASGDAADGLDASPRGGAPGFVRVIDDRALLIPDSPGNNRLDTLENIIETGRIVLHGRRLRSVVGPMPPEAAPAPDRPAII